MVSAEPVMLGLLACNWIANFLFCIVILIVLNILFTKGQRCLIEKTTSFLLHLPGFKYVSTWFLKNELKKFLQQIGLSETSGSIKSRIKTLPEKGMVIDNNNYNNPFAWKMSGSTTNDRHSWSYVG